MTKTCDHVTKQLAKLKREWDEMDLAAQLRLLAHYSLDVKRELLLSEVPPNDGRAESTRERQLLLSAADSTINQQIKVDENTMRAQHTDGLPALLERMAKAIRGE